MGMIRIYEKGPKKPKKKPGWQDEQKAHEEWLKGVNSVKLFGDKKVKPSGAKLPKKMPSLREQIEAKKRTEGQSIITTAPMPGKKVLRPEIEYKDNPEMLERELKARERVFPVAPAYNKGGDQLVTPEFLKDLKAGTTRRRS